MISATKSTLSSNNLKILRHKVTKNLTNFCRKFCEPHPVDDLVKLLFLSLRRISPFFADNLGHFVINYFFLYETKHSNLTAKIRKRSKKNKFFWIDRLLDLNPFYILSILTRKIVSKLTY